MKTEIRSERRYHKKLYSFIRLSQNRNESINSIDIAYMIALCKKIILWYASLHDFHILYKTVPQLNVNSIIQSNEKEGVPRN